MLVFFLGRHHVRPILFDYVNSNFGVRDNIINFVIWSKLKVAGIFNGDFIISSELIFGLELVKYFLLKLRNSFGSE